MIIVGFYTSITTLLRILLSCWVPSLLLTPKKSQGKFCFTCIKCNLIITIDIYKTINQNFRLVQLLQYIAPSFSILHLSLSPTISQVHLQPLLSLPYHYTKQPHSFLPHFPTPNKDSYYHHPTQLEYIPYSSTYSLLIDHQLPISLQLTITYNYPSTKVLHHEQRVQFQEKLGS